MLQKNSTMSIYIWIRVGNTFLGRRKTFGATWYNSWTRLIFGIIFNVLFCKLHLAFKSWISFAQYCMPITRTTFLLERVWRMNSWICSWVGLSPFCSFSWFNQSRTSWFARPCNGPARPVYCMRCRQIWIRKRASHQMCSMCWDNCLLRGQNGLSCRDAITL